ncbi:NIPSNAP family protein [Serratia marcescens]|uniref:NIPSNAP family protein n=1 Tax=Serratia TaxID=613 RepID=UPI0018D7C677|nr:MULTISPECIES: NIPSNAP family protein [Serratia]MBH3169078.1 NIPSNAP family protein [Serratia marcescens]MCF1608959.1 NIPSNAP family protein [Serratia marcescens]UMK58841.1 NIPSNAP family protein [Serratia marcescens]HBK4690265.1 NIPSNAP family protein [Serratia marcescens]
MTTVIEVLQYTLKPGTGAAFHDIMKEQSVPLHLKIGVKVLRFGNSLHDPDNYYLVRSFLNESEMESQLTQFYADARWREGPRSVIVNMISGSHRVVMPAEPLIKYALGDNESGNPFPFR